MSSGIQVPNPAHFLRRHKKSEGYGWGHRFIHSVSVNDNEFDRNKSQTKEDIDSLAYRILE